MKKENGNHYMAAIVDELYQLGIREAVLSPGSRSTPLSMLFCKYGKFKVFLNIDERSAGFFALGIGKEHNRPVVLVCTSGSAAAHYYPAVAEARYSRIPLLILTADRPPELQNIGAPQTMNQSSMFGTFVNYYEELSIPGKGELFTYPRMVMRKAYLKCQGAPKGPVQINVPVREPLVPELNQEWFEQGRSKLPFVFHTGSSSVEIDCSNMQGKNGIIVCGADAACTCHEEIIELGTRLKTPIVADPLSNLRSFESDIIIDSYDAFLKQQTAMEELKPDYMILLGQPPVSKRLQQFLSLHKGAACFQVDASLEYRNPSLITTQYIQADTREFIRQIPLVNKQNRYLKQWQCWQKKMRTKLDTVSQESALFEGKIVNLLQEAMPENSRLVAANSMAIRDIDYFWRTQEQRIKLLCNRGTNGIDGTISTALGISTSDHTTVLLTGDLAFFHDMNGLLIGKTHALRLIIILFNNNGGGIFEYLPQKGKQYFEYLFSTPHGIDFRGIQLLYGVNYRRITDYEDFQDSFQEALAAEGICVIEVGTDKEESWKLHETYTAP